MTLTVQYGQPFLKYLVTLSVYSQDGYTQPTLANDLLFVARKAELTKKESLTVATIYNWIRGSKIPLWAQFAAFELAVRHGWRIVDSNDLLQSLWIVFKHDKVTTEQAARNAFIRRGLTIPVPLRDDVTQHLEMLMRGRKNG